MTEIKKRLCVKGKKINQYFFLIFKFYIILWTLVKIGVIVRLVRRNKLK